MIDKQISWAITLGEALQINNNKNICIPINYEDYNNIFNNTNKVSLEMKKELYSNTFLFNDMLDIGINEDSKYKLTPSISMYPNDDKTSYKIGYNIASIFNSSLIKLGVDSHLDSFDYYNKQELEHFREKLIKTIEDGLTLKLLFSDDKNMEEKDKKQILMNLENNVNLILRIMIRTNKKLDALIAKQIKEQKELRDNSQIIHLTPNSIFIPKNLMLYSAVKSLMMFGKTGNIDYYRYAKDYYKNVSNREDGVKPEWTNNIFIGKQKYRYDFSTYNNIFEKVRDFYFPKLYIDLDKEDQEIFTKQGRTLKKCQKNQIIKLNGNSLPKKKIDYQKVNNALKRKITFYKGLKNVGLIDSVERELDYIGFVLENNYVILDKFYDLNKDGTYKPATNNAVYIVSIDVLEACNYDKKKIREYIKNNKDFKAFRFYHNEKDSYQEKILKVLSYKPVSLKKFEDIK